MAYRRAKELDARDKCIVRLFYDCLYVRKLSVMDAYAYCAEYYDVSEVNVRKIIQKASRSDKA